MASVNGPSIVTNGLVLYLDAANTDSYIGSGTAWSDLSGNKYDGALVGGISYTYSYQGGLVQNGTNGYIAIPYVPSLSFPGNTPFSVQFTIKNISFSTNYAAILSFGEQDTSPYGGWVIYYYYNALYTGTYGAVSMARFAGNNVGAGGDVTYKFSSSLESIAPTTWVYTYGPTDGGKLYKNSILVTYNVTTGTASTPTNGPFTIGRRAGNTTRVTNCVINSVSIYNRTLSASEITQNYNATKARFGLT